MPRKYQKRSKQHWAPNAMIDALAEHKELKTSIRKLSEKYNIPKSTLSDHIKGPISVQGRKPVRTFSFYNLSKSQ